MCECSTWLNAFNDTQFDRRHDCVNVNLAYGWSECWCKISFYKHDVLQYKHGQHVFLFLGQKWKLKQSIQTTKAACFLAVSFKKNRNLFLRMLITSRFRISWCSCQDRFGPSFYSNVSWWLLKLFHEDLFLIQPISEKKMLSLVWA